MNHSKSKPCENGTKFDHSKSGHVQISDPHCIEKLLIVGNRGIQNYQNKQIKTGVPAAL